MMIFSVLVTVGGECPLATCEDGSVTLLQSQAAEKLVITSPPPEMELRARRLVYEAAQVEGAAFSLDRFISWITGNDAVEGPSHSSTLRLVERLHAISKTAMDHGYTMGEVGMICVCLLCIGVVSCVLWPRRSA